MNYPPQLYYIKTINPIKEIIGEVMCNYNKTALWTIYEQKATI